MAGLRTLATAALYLVLKSNGLHHSKNLPEKFSFSPKPVPTNIAKKLPLQLRPKPLFIAFFNFSHKRLTFVFTGESGYTLDLRKKSHTRAHTAKQGRFGWGRYYYPRTVSHVVETLRGQGVERQTLPLLGLGLVCSRSMQREPSEQRCAHAHRCSEASRPRWAA